MLLEQEEGDRVGFALVLQGEGHQLGFAVGLCVGCGGGGGHRLGSVSPGTSMQICALEHGWD